MNQVICKNIYMEDVFKWFCEHVFDSCGDGCAVIVCGNYKEAAKYFEQWYNANHNVKLMEWHELDADHGYVNYHDSNENFIFSNSIMDMYDGDYVFIIEEECFHYPVMKNKKESLLPVNRNIIC